MSRKSLVIFVHGINSDEHCWDKLHNLMNGDPEMCAAFDWRCFGYSAQLFFLSPLKRQPRYDEIAQRLDTYIQEHLVDSYVSLSLVGHSQGGLIIEAYLANKLKKGRGKEPERIRKVLLIATSTLGSALGSGIRKALSPLWHNAQERALRVFDPEVAETRRVVEEQIVKATATTSSTRRSIVRYPFRLFGRPRTALWRANRHKHSKTQSLFAEITPR